MMMSQGVLIVISGPSAAGKGTICRELLSRHKELAYSISATTRAPRDGEAHGVNYWFMDKDEFRRMIEDGELLEWAEVYGNYYGTPLQRVRDMLRSGKDVILEIDTQGAMKVKKKMPEGVFIYILPPSLGELEKRIHKRGADSRESMRRRLNCAADEIKRARDYHYVVVNDVVDRAVAKIAAIIEAERSSVSRNAELIGKIIEDRGEIV